MTSTLHTLADLYRKPGPWVTVYTDASTGTVDSLHADDVRPENIATALEAADASKDDRKAVAQGYTNSRGLFTTLEAWHHLVKRQHFSDGVLE